jgi:hypothetical protein
MTVAVHTNEAYWVSETPRNPGQIILQVDLSTNPATSQSRLRDSNPGPPVMSRAKRPDRRQSGYSSFRHVRGSAGWAFGVRSSREL